jgi:hypothetical protein
MADDTFTDQHEITHEGMSSVPPPPVEPLSISDKFVGILTEPAETYANVRAAGPRTSDWLVPVGITALILVVGMFLRFSNPEFMAQITDKQAESISKQVDSGAMTQEQADQAVEQMEGMSGFIKITGTLSAGVGFVIMFFVISLLYWLGARFVMKGDATFGLIMSAAGLSTFISAIDQLLSLLLSLVTGKPFANLSPALFMDGDMASAGTRLMMMLNPIVLWSYYVLGIGFEHVAQISRVKGMILAFAFFVLAAAISSVSSFGM